MQVHDQKLDSGKAWERTYTKGTWSRQWLHAPFVMGMSHSAARGSKVTFQKIYLLYKHFSITRFVSSAHILTCSWRSSFTTAFSFSKLRDSQPVASPRHAGERQWVESSCPNENAVDEAAAPVSFATPDELKSPSPTVNRLRPRLRPKKYSG